MEFIGVIWFACGNFICSSNMDMHYIYTSKPYKYIQIKCTQTDRRHRARHQHQYCRDRRHRGGSGRLCCDKFVNVHMYYNFELNMCSDFSACYYWSRTGDFYLYYFVYTFFVYLIHSLLNINPRLSWFIGCYRNGELPSKVARMLLRSVHIALDIERFEDQTTKLKANQLYYKESWTSSMWLVIICKHVQKYVAPSVYKSIN